MTLRLFAAALLAAFSLTAPTLAEEVSKLQPLTSDLQPNDARPHGCPRRAQPNWTHGQAREQESPGRCANLP